MFAEALGKELREIHLKEGAILQYVDDILTCSPSMEALDKNTIEVLNFLGAQGYRVSQTNAQISKQQVKYLGHIINSRSRQLSPDRKQTILGLSTPKMKKHLLTFLGMAGFCRIWSFIKNGVRRAGYVIMSAHRVIEAKHLPTNTSAQEAELIALTRALTLGEGKIVNIYTDSKYAFFVLHAHSAIWKER